jgi:imidazolonepropionase-like amidohydrolase
MRGSGYSLDMRILPILCLAGGLSLAATPDPPTVALRCGHLLDVQSGGLIDNAVILTAGGRITAVGAGLPIPPGTSIVQLPEATCLPGLIDVHVHLTADVTKQGYESLGISIPRSTVTGVKSARQTLLAGFTTVRNVGADGYADVALRDGIEDGDIDGPRMLVSGPALGITGGHCDNNLLAPQFHYTDPGVADGPWAARAKVREVVKYGADLIKICASGGVLSKGDQPGTPQYTLEEIRAIVEEAHKLGRKVAAHAHGTHSIKDSILGGVDSVEHASLIDDEGIALAKQHGTVLVFDIYNDDFILQEGAKMGVLPESLEKERNLGKTQRQNFRRALLAGARLAFGTDAGVYPHGDNARQFALMVEYGMKPLDAIRSATTGAAELMGRGKEAGVITKGAFADVIAVAGDPRADVKVLENVRFVMKNGRVYKNTWGK